MTPPQTPSELDKAVERFCNERRNGDSLVTMKIHVDDREVIEEALLAAKRLKEVEQANEYCCKLLKDYGLDEAAPLEKLVRSIIGRVKEAEMERDALRINRLVSGQHIATLRIALRKSHAAMVSWCSSEYASNKLSKEVGYVLYGVPLSEIEQELATLRTEYKNALAALEYIRQISTGEAQIADTDTEAMLPISRLSTEVLSTPHAIAAMKKGEV